MNEIWLIEVFPHRWQSAPRTPIESKSRRDELWQCALIWQEKHFIDKVNEWLDNGIMKSNPKYKKIQIRRMMLSQADLMIGSVYVNDPCFLAKMMDFGYKNAATLFHREIPDTSPFTKEAQLETPVGFLARNLNTVNQWCATSVGL